MELTKAQEERFWKWCGFIRDDSPVWAWRTPDGERWWHGELPTDDLNALLKWVVPKLQPCYLTMGTPAFAGMPFWVTLHSPNGCGKQVKNESLAAAIVEAVWPLVEQEGKNGI